MSRCAAAAAVGAALGLAAPAASADPTDVAPQVAFNQGEIETPRAAAMAGALRVYGFGIEGLMSNPAGMAGRRLYHIGAFTRFMPQAGLQSYGAAVVDGLVSSTYVAGGVAFNWMKMDPDGIDRYASDLRWALAVPFVDKFMVGVGGRYIWLNQDGVGPLGLSLASGGLEKENILRTASLDVGLTLFPVEILGVGFAARNVINTGSGFLPTTLGPGIGVGSDEFTIEADVTWDFDSFDETSLRAMVGGELVLAQAVPLRLGYRFEQGTSSHMVSGGAGFIHRMFSVEAAVQHTFDEAEGTGVFVSVKYHMDGANLSPSPADTF